MAHLFAFELFCEELVLLPDLLFGAHTGHVVGRHINFVPAAHAQTFTDPGGIADMEIKGERECTECGARWSYYETGEVACPECGSFRSVGREQDRKLHTDNPADLDLTSVRNDLADRPIEEVADEVSERCRTYLRKRGFVSGGELRQLDETYLAASELLVAIGTYERSLTSGAIDRTTDDEEQLYVLALLGLDRPPAEHVPRSLAVARGLAAARAVDAYRTDALDWLDTTEDQYPEVRTAFGRLDDHVRRIEALDGDVPPMDADRLTEAARDLGRYMREDDEVALVRAQDRLDTLGR